MEQVGPLISFDLVWNGTLMVNISILRSPIIAVPAAALANGLLTSIKYLWRSAGVLATTVFGFLRFNS